VMSRPPFTIKLLDGSSGDKPSMTLGVDSGSKWNFRSKRCLDMKPKGDNSYLPRRIDLAPNMSAIQIVRKLKQ